MAANPLWVPERAEVIFIQHSPAVGQEIPDWHPMLVASPMQFNDNTDVVIGFPMTHSAQHADDPFVVTIPGIKGPAYILANQPKSFDWRTRGAKPHALGTGHFAELAEALQLLDDICGICPSFGP